MIINLMLKLMTLCNRTILMVHSGCVFNSETWEQTCRGSNEKKIKFMFYSWQDLDKCVFYRLL